LTFFVAVPRPAAHAPKPTSAAAEGETGTSDATMPALMSEKRPVCLKSCLALAAPSRTLLKISAAPWKKKDDAKKEEAKKEEVVEKPVLAVLQRRSTECLRTTESTIRTCKTAETAALRKIAAKDEMKKREELHKK